MDNRSSDRVRVPTHAGSTYGAYVTSPVYAPLPLTQQFCADTAISLRRLLCTKGMWTKAGATTTSACQVKVSLPSPHRSKATTGACCTVICDERNFQSAVSGRVLTDIAWQVSFVQLVHKLMSLVRRPILQCISESITNRQASLSSNAKAALRLSSCRLRQHA